MEREDTLRHSTCPVKYMFTTKHTESLVSCKIHLWSPLNSTFEVTNGRKVTDGEKPCWKQSKFLMY